MSKKRILIHAALIVLGIVTFWKSLSAYKEAEMHLTPASVSVSGYTRRDGTYVRPYDRRPPGGAIHDRPYENAMFFYSILMVMGGGLIIIPIGMMVRGRIHTTGQRREELHEKLLAYREAIHKEIEIDKTLLSACQHQFSEGYGSSGLLACAYSDVIAKATIENSRSRSKSELPSSPEKIKQAIIAITEISITRQENETALGLLKILYLSLARFLPESQSLLVTERNLGWLSEDPNHPSLRRSKEADRIDAEVDAEEDRLTQEFDQITLELLEGELAKAQREKTNAEKQLLENFYKLSSDAPEKE